MTIWENLFKPDPEILEFPNEVTVAFARHIYSLFQRNKELSLEVDADALGGVGITVYSADHTRSAWIACMNNAVTTVVYFSTSGIIPESKRWHDDSTAAEIIAWVTQKE
jgi:hypothetical protein